MRQREDCHDDLLQTHDGVLHHRRVVSRPRLVERRPHQREHQCRDPGRDDRTKPQQRPSERGAGQYRPATDQEQHLRNLDRAAAEVVDDLPLRHEREAVAFRTIGTWHRAA